MVYLWQFVFTQKDKELDVVAACQRTHWNRFPTDFWCKGTTFHKGIVRFRPFPSANCVIWPNKSVSVRLQLQVDAILLCHVPHRHRGQHLVTGPYAKHGEFITMAREPSLKGFHWYARRIGKLGFWHWFHDYWWMIIDCWWMIIDYWWFSNAGICVDHRRYLRWLSQVSSMRIAGICDEDRSRERGWQVDTYIYKKVVREEINVLYSKRISRFRDFLYNIVSPCHPGASERQVRFIFFAMVNIWNTTVDIALGTLGHFPKTAVLPTDLLEAKLHCHFYGKIERKWG